MTLSLRRAVVTGLLSIGLVGLVPTNSARAAGGACQPQSTSNATTTPSLVSTRYGLDYLTCTGSQSFSAAQGIGYSVAIFPRYVTGSTVVYGTPYTTHLDPSALTVTGPKVRRMAPPVTANVLVKVK